MRLSGLACRPSQRYPTPHVLHSRQHVNQCYLPRLFVWLLLSHQISSIPCPIYLRNLVARWYRWLVQRRRSRPPRGNTPNGYPPHSFCCRRRLLSLPTCEAKLALAALLNDCHDDICSDLHWYRVVYSVRRGILQPGNLPAGIVRGSDRESCRGWWLPWTILAVPLT